MKSSTQKYINKYTITRPTDGAQFEIERTTDGARIYSRHLWTRQPAAVWAGLELPDELPIFASFIKAVEFAKKNISKLY